MKSVYLLVISILLFGIQSVFAEPSGLSGPCETVSQTGTRLELIDFGIAYSEDFKFSSQDDRLELYGGVCIKRETGDIWQLEAESVVIENASVELELQAKGVSFQFDGWTLSSENLISTKDFFQFKVVDISKDAMKITSGDLKLDLTTDSFVLTDVNAIYRNEFQISGQTMNITEDEVVFNEAYVTTCMCEEDHLYDVKSPKITYSTGSNTLVLSQADLSFLNSTIPLGEDYTIGNNIDLQFPTPFLDYSEDLELALKNIVLAKGVSADIGAQGVDAEHDFNPYGLVKLNLSEVTSPGLGGNLNGVIGKSTSGLQADLNYARLLGNEFSWDVGTRNQSWTGAAFLHEAYSGLSFRALPLKDSAEAGTLEVVSRVFAALSSQELSDERFTAPRLGLSVSNNYSQGALHRGLLKFSFVPEIIYYPSENSFQYAVTVSPSLNINSNGFSFNTSYTHKFTNSASPFTSTVDKASEARSLNVSLGFRETTPEGNSFGISTNTAVDFLKNAQASQSLIRSVGVNMNSVIKGDQTEFKPYLSAELARFLTGIEDASLDDAYNDDYLQVGIDSFFYDDWELGLRARINPTVQADEELIEVLEMGLGLPLRQGEFLLKPYIGVNFANLVTDVDEFQISTYGLSAHYECCGDANAFFHVRDGNLTTGLKWPF